MLPFGLKDIDDGRAGVLGGATTVGCFDPDFFVGVTVVFVVVEFIIVELAGLEIVELKLVVLISLFVRKASTGIGLSIATP